MALLNLPIAELRIPCERLEGHRIISFSQSSTGTLDIIHHGSWIGSPSEHLCLRDKRIRRKKERVTAQMIRLAVGGGPSANMDWDELPL